MTEGTPHDTILFEAARAGDLAALAGLLDEHPDKLMARTPPYQWTRSSAGPTSRGC